MSLRENLKKKMLIERLSSMVCQSIGPTGVSRKIDKETMRKLFSLSPFTLEKRRDLELYFRDLGQGVGEIISLDNELPLYGNTTVDDVALRRSPEVKEMISIRNIIKILNDKDIRICKGSGAVQHVHDLALDLLDLSYTEKDIQEMVDDGIDALARADSDEVLELLELFVELLGYKSVPAAVLVNNYVMYGRREEGGNGRESYRPIIMYNDRTNVLRMIKEPVFTDDAEAEGLISGIASGDIEPDGEGNDIFRFLKEAALAKKQATIH